MGDVADCTGSLDGELIVGKAQLEGEFLQFRGDGRKLRIALSDIDSVAADSEALHVTWPGGILSLGIGRSAARWADKILHPKSLIDKIGLPPGSRIALSSDLPEELGPLLAKAGFSALALDAPNIDTIFAAADSCQDLMRIAELKQILPTSGALWVISRKGKDAGIKDTDVIAAGRSAGLVDTKVVGFSPTHTALKFVIPRSAR